MKAGRRSDLRCNETGLEGLEQAFTQAESLTTAFLQVFFGITLVMRYVFCFVFVPVQQPVALPVKPPAATG